MGNFKDPKKKTKRKKGKKFVYKGPTEKVDKVNPFEELSKKKFMKQGKAYAGVIEEYNTKSNTNSFVDRRIGEGSKYLSYDDKMKLRYKAQQMINLKNRKNKFSLLDDGKEEDVLTHRGKKIKDGELSDVEKSDDDEIYNKLDNYMEEMDQNRGKLSRKEIIQNIINKSKLLKEERQRIKQENRDKIEMLDENFAEFSTLLKKRGRTFTKKTDDYDKYASTFVHSDKTHPTDRLRTDGEIELEKEIQKERLNKRRLREEIMRDDDESEKGEGDKQELPESKKLTKKERIEKLIADRLNKAGKITKEDIISKQDDEEGDESEEDNVSDLDEFDNKAENEDGEYDDEEDFEGEEMEDFEGEEMEDEEFSQDEEDEISEKITTNKNNKNNKNKKSKK